ncbi:MAG: glycosyltransferase, partial [Verrucomicrobiota bacterium]
SDRPHMLMFEPRTEGHHLMWLAILIRAFLPLYRMSIVADLRENKTRQRLAEYNDPRLEEPAYMAAHDASGQPHGGDMMSALLRAYRESQPDIVFVNSLDEFSSKLMRKSVFGRNPLGEIRCGLSGVVHRPRFLEPERSLRNLSKQIGFRKLDRAHFFKHLFILDDDLVASEESEQRYRLKLHLIPVPAEGNFNLGKAESRQELGLAPEIPVLMHYGVGAKRKGLQLLVEALNGLPASMPYHLIAAGRQPEGAPWVPELEKLAANGKATVMNRYISPHEEVLCFGASDLITLPYLAHYGAANILTKAAQAVRPVLASDYHLIGRQVESYGLGYTFRDCDAESLRNQLAELLPQRSRWEHQFDDALRAHAERCSVEVFQDIFTRVDYR